MAINTSKLISAAVLQNFLIGKDALPLAGGIVTLYQDSNRTVLKNWYEQTGVPGSYVYTALPNPLTLSAAGTIQDLSGNDVDPFYYPWNEADENIAEAYFITVTNSLGTLQFTRANFPFNPAGQSPSSVVPILTNYVINNRFWRNIGSITQAGITNTWTTQYATSGTYYYATLSPDQHDGFSMPDFNYIRNATGSITETITFNKFASTTILEEDITPEFYLNYNCTADSSGSTLKVFQFPISLHLLTLVNQGFSFTIQGQNLSGAATIGVYLYQFMGTGTTSSLPQLLGNITFGANWEKFTLPGKAFPPISAALSNAGDDAWYIQIAMPTGGGGAAVCNMNFALPSIYLSGLEQDIPTNSFSTYDQIDSIVALPRTGDIKISLNTFYPYGWVPMNDGTLAAPGSVTAPGGTLIAYQKQDGWPLFSLLWNMYHNLVLNGSQLVTIFDSSGSSTSYGASALADWNSLKQISLSKIMGQVILGTVPQSALMPIYSHVVTFSNSSGPFPANILVFTSVLTLNFFIGMPVYFTDDGGSLPTGVNANTIYYIGITNGTTIFGLSTTFANAMAGVFIAYTNSGSGTITVNSALAGTYEGQYQHTMLEGELATHSHPGSTALRGGIGATLVFAATGSGDGSTTGPLTIAPDGTSTPFNVTQPGVFYNMFMKL